MSGGRTGMSDDPTQTPRAIGGRAPDVFRPGGWVPMREHRHADEVDFVIVGTGADGADLRDVFPAAGGFRLGRSRADQAALDRRPHQRRGEPGPVRLQQQRQGRGRQHGSLRDGGAALPSRVVQGPHRAGLRLRLAAQLAGDVGLLYGGGAGAEDFRPRHLSLRSAPSALPLPRARDECRRAGVGAGLRGHGHSLDGKPRSPPSPRRATSHRPAYIAASAASAARPTPSNPR